MCVIGRFRQLLSGLALYLDRGVAPLGTWVLATVSRQPESYPPDLAADRSSGAAPYSPYLAPAKRCLPAPGVVPHGRRFRLDTS